MRYIIYILLVGFLYGQSEEKTISVPKSDVIEWANKLKQYETSDSLQTSLISDLELQVKKLEENSTLDSLIISTRVHQIDLLKELEAKGHSFKSGTDTEVLLKLFILEGKNCLNKLNGFFAFAIFDKLENVNFTGFN